MTISEKVRSARDLLGISQEDLANLIGVSRRSVVAWETAGATPRGWRMNKLAEILQVSADYLRSDEITDPLYGMEKKEYIDEARSRFGQKGAKELDYLLERNTALFAGGEISEEAKDAYFEAVTKAYFACKEAARKSSGKKT